MIERLRNRIRKVETASRVDDEARISSGCVAIDRLLPGGGYQRGALVQWLTGGGQGADYLSLLLARQACADGGALVVFDPLNQFFPPAAAAVGINLDNLIILRTDQANQELETDLLWSIDQSLRCPAVAAVWGPLDHIDERWFRRFQLSAESSGCLGLFVQPIRQARQPSWAEVQWLVSSVPGHRTPADESRRSRSPNGTFDNGELYGTQVPPGGRDQPSAQINSPRNQLVRLQLTRCWGTQTGKTVNLSINTVTGNVQLARRDHEQHLAENRKPNRTRKQPSGGKPPGGTGTFQCSNVSSKGPLSVVSQLAHPTAGRQRA